jgi:hypothetical protein
VLCCCLEGRTRLWSGRYHLATGLSANMRFGLVMPLGSHESRIVPRVLTDLGSSLSICCLVPLVREHRKKGSDPLGGSWSRMWMWLEDRRVETEGLLHV